MTDPLTVDPLMAGPVRYRRRPRCVFRALHGRGWVGGPGHSTIAIEGSALFVFLALDGESSAAELATDIQRTWPELGTVHTSGVQDALDVLLEHGLVEVAGPARNGVNPA